MAKRLFSVEWMPLFLIAFAAVLFLTAISESFASNYNIFVILRILSVTCLVALSQMVVIAIGQMNLAVGAIGGLVAVLFGGMLELYGLPIGVAALIGLCVGGLAGAFGGYLIAATGINGFVITLAMMSVLTGLNLGLTESIPFYEMPAELKSIYDSYIGPVPTILLIPALATLAIGVMFSFTRPGRHMLAMGGNKHAAELAGISILRTTVFAHGISGLLAAAGGIVAVARLGTAEPTIGANWLLASFAAPVIGGAVLAGGHVSVIGTLIATLIVVLLENGLLLMRIDPYYVQFCLGALILLTVVFNEWRSRAPRAKGGQSA